MNRLLLFSLPLKDSYSKPPQSSQAKDLWKDIHWVMEERNGSTVAPCSLLSGSWLFIPACMMYESQQE
ncbi:MAG: hypothetical protein WCJ37_13870, partial [Syntrophus sp. (in: bacteria)]